MVVWRPWVWQTSCSSNSMTSHSEIPNLQIILMPLQKLRSTRELIGNEFPVERKQREKGVRIWWETGEWNQKLVLLYPGIEFPPVLPIFFLLNSREIKVHCWRRTQLRQTRKKGSISRKDQTFLVQVYPVFFSSKVSLSLSLSLFPFSLLPMELFHGSLPVSLFFLLSLSMKKPVWLFSFGFVLYRLLLGVIIIRFEIHTFGYRKSCPSKSVSGTLAFVGFWKQKTLK